MQRHPELRWLASVVLIVAAGAVVATSLSGVFRENSALPVTSPDQLIEQVSQPHVGGYYGTITAQVDLGLPKTVSTALTAAVPAGGLLRGSHQLRYWYADADRQRVAVVNPDSEQDVFRNGDEVWEWDTGTRVARRSPVSGASGGALPLALSSPAALTPPELADRILSLVGPDSDTALRSGDDVDGRKTYELVVRPDSTASRIGEIDIQLDGRQDVPLSVRLFAVDAAQPALDVAFTDITFATPASQNFSFTPPDDAKTATGAKSSDPDLEQALDSVTTVGSGWLTALSYTSSELRGSALAAVAYQFLGTAAHAVKGAWGTGRVLETPVLTVLVTSKGRILAGAVTPDVLYAAVK